jgi:hypothetical protein
MNNRLFQECKVLDNDLQTLVYDNYLTFIEAADTISELNQELNGLDSELENLSSSIKRGNTRFEKIDQTMGPKWQEIAKLSKLEVDLSKLKHLSELPQMFKNAISLYDSADVTVFEEAVTCYRNYSDVLIGYKSTKFLISLCGEIKSYIARVKQLI